MKRYYGIVGDNDCWCYEKDNAHNFYHINAVKKQLNTKELKKFNHKIYVVRVEHSETEETYENVK